MASRILILVLFIVNVLAYCFGVDKSQELVYSYLLPPANEVWGKEDPFTMRVIGNESEQNLEGFIPDLMEKLSQELAFDYNLKLVADGSYGHLVNGTWVGMIGEVIREEADIAAAGMTISREREQVVDFTKPFLSVGITGLRKRPKRDSENTISSLEELSSSDEFGIGVIAGGSTMKFFMESKDPVIQKLGDKILSSSSSWCLHTTECLERVIRSDSFIFFTETTVVDYITKRNCYLTTFGGVLEGSLHGFGLGMRKGDPFVDELIEGIRRLQEDGDLHLLYRKWWLPLGYNCEAKD